MKYLFVSLSLKGSSGRKSWNQNFDEILSGWNSIKDHDYGSLDLRTCSVNGDINTCGRSLFLSFEGGNSIFLLYNHKTDEERIFHNRSSKGENIEIRGDIWPDSMVCNNIDIMNEIVISFILYRNVSKNILY